MKKFYSRIRSQWLTSCLWALFCLNANISWKAEQNLVTFNQNDLQMELSQIYVTFFTNWPSRMAASAITKNKENIQSHELPNGFWVPNVKAQSRCDIAFRVILVVTHSRHDVPRVAQRHGTTAAHTRRRASVVVDVQAAKEQGFSSWNSPLCGWQHQTSFINDPG